MPTIIQAIILGIIQGLTEYIPVSSTAHLILVPWLFGWQYDVNAKFVFDILIQWGTLLGVTVYFWRDIVAIVREVINGLIQRKPFGTPNARLGWLVVIAPGSGLKNKTRSLLFEQKAVAWLNAEVKKLEETVMNVYGVPLAATGGEIVDDIFGNLHDLKWEDLVHTFLLT